MIRASRFLLAAAAIIAQPALAQVAAGVAPDPGQPGTPASDTAQSGPMLDDIIVSAQKRDQSLQDVPISINAFNAEALGALSAETIGVPRCATMIL